MRRECSGECGSLSVPPHFMVLQKSPEIGGAQDSGGDMNSGGVDKKAIRFAATCKEFNCTTSK